MTLKVMIVDDEQLIIKGMKTIIQKKSWQYNVVGEALGGEEALSVAEKCQPDLIITDICMPDINGLVLIERLKELLPETKFVVLSGYGEFSYAQEALRLGVADYLLKPVNSKKIYELLEKITKEFETAGIRALEEQAKKLKENLYQYLYLKKTPAARYIQDIMEPGKYYTIELISCPEGISEEEKRNTELLTELFFAKHGNGLCTSVGGETAVVVQTRTVSEIHIFNRSLEAEIPCELQIVSSSSSRDVKDLEQLFWQARQCQGMAFYKTEKERILEWRGEHLNPLTIDLINNEQIQQIERGIKEGRPSDVRSQYEALLDKYERLMIFPGDVVRFIQGTFRLVINQLANEGIIKPVINEVLDEQIYHINNCRKKAELIYGITAIIEAIIKECEESNSNSNTSKIVYEIKKYIQNHYQEDITLTALASQVFISPKYLSDLFKKETGDNYTTYLISVRMEHAKQLLGQLNYKIYEIAEMVGYPNPKHFIKVFKKTVGMTPGEYRNRSTFYGI